MNNSFRFSAVLLFVIGLFALSCTELSIAADTETKKQIAIIQIVEHPALNNTRQGILDVLHEQKVQVHFQAAQGSSVLAAQIAQQFVGSKADVLVGIGTSAAQALVSANQYQQIPIVFSSVTNPLEAKLVRDLNHPDGVITGVSNYVDPAIQFRLFKEILPHLSKIGIIYNPGEPNSAVLVQQMEKVARDLELTLILAPANSTVEVPQATQTLIKQVDAIFINNDNTALSAFDSIVHISTQHQIPVFASDTDMIQRGALAALGPNQYEVGKKTGHLILKILAGERISQLPVLFEDKLEITLNCTQAAQLKIQFTDSLIQKSSIPLPKPYFPTHE